MFCGSFIFFLGYEILFYHSFKEKETYKEIGKIVVFTILAVLLYFIILNLIAFVRTGELVGIKNIIYGQTVFLGSGFMMLRMDLWHPWILLVAIYAIALAGSVRKLKFMGYDNSSCSFEKNSIIFSLAILGMGLFSYYQGRSHNQVFIYVVYPAVLLLGIFLDNLLKKYIEKDKINFVYKNIIIAILLTTLTVASSTTVYALCTNDSIKNMLNKEYIKEHNIMETKTEKIKETRKIIGDFDVVLSRESYYYLALDKEDKKNFPSYVDLFKYEDCKKIIEYMQENKVNLYTDSKIYNILKARYRQELNELRKNGYEIRKVGNDILFIYNVQE